MIRLELNLLIESFHEFERAKRLGSISNEYTNESAVIYLSQGDALALGVSEGDIVEVSSRYGSVKVKARVRSGIGRGLAFMPPSPFSMALMGPSERLSATKVVISKSSGEPTNLATLFTS